ncbi:MAG: glycosyltransferase family 61 protein [Chloroflexota bacterium]
MLWSSLRPIDRANHRLIGFPEAWANRLFGADLRASDAPPAIALHRDARVIPCDPFAANTWAAGGILSADGRPVPLVRGWTSHSVSWLGLTEPVAAEPSGVIDGSVLYLGWLFDNFGHRLVESLARVWALPHVPPSTPVLFHYWPGSEPSAAALETLALFGVSRDRIIIPDRPVDVRSLLVPDPLYLLHTILHDRAGALYQAAAGRVAGPIEPGSQPLYLSRTALPPAQRPVVGETVLESILRDHGFRIEHPETLPLAEQIRLVRSHDSIVLCSGSATQLLLFARPGTRVHLIAHQPLLGSCLLSFEAAGLRSTTHNALLWRRNSQLAVQLDVPAAIACLVDEGLLPGSARSSSLPPASALAAEYDEAWLLSIFVAHPSALPGYRDDVDAASARLPDTAWPAFAALAAGLPPDDLDDGEADALMARFAAALAAEPDPARRARFAATVRGLAPAALARCGPAVRERAGAAIAAHLPEPA